ncbi:hypothetical protein J2Z83_002691 [Virgibacillus natechei]|uniref:Uncharacterized protein n=1 Tax=Virgibacillus natechei TaxID=1216297 RepID=A0ABS4IHZ1_9BACI|nr:hypothetical protein [Virgibacillus natechei]
MISKERFKLLINIAGTGGFLVTSDDLTNAKSSNHLFMIKSIMGVSQKPAVKWILC